MANIKSYAALASLLVLSMCWVGAFGADAASAKPASADWPGWRGVNRDGKSPDTNLLKSWPAEGPERLWKVDGLGAGYSSACVVEETIYLTGQKTGQLYLSVLDTKGNKKWSVAVGPAFTKSHSGARSTVTYDDGLLYIESGMGDVNCYDAKKSGALIWSRKMSEFGGRLPRWGFSESVFIIGNYAIITPGGRACMVALDKKTGKTVWESPPFGQAHYSSPIYVEFNKVPMIINGTRSGLIAVDARDGKTLWTSKFSAGNTANCPTPAYSDGYVFWATGYGKGGVCLKLEASGSKVVAREMWRTKDMVSHHGGYVIVDGYIYGNHGGGWSCIELKSGQTKWRAKGVGKGSLCYADGMLYLFGERDGPVMLAAASPEALKPAGTINSGDFKGSGPSWAHPVVIGGKLYLRYADALYCYDVSAQNGS